MDKVTSLLLQ